MVLKSKLEMVLKFVTDLVMLVQYNPNYNSPTYGLNHKLLCVCKVRIEVVYVLGVYCIDVSTVGLWWYTLQCVYCLTLSVYMQTLS